MPLGLAVGTVPSVGMAPPNPPLGMDPVGKPPAHCEVLPLFPVEPDELLEELEQAARIPTPASAARLTPANRTVSALRRSLIAAPRRRPPPVNAD